jgi:hypothetical protein
MSLSGYWDNKDTDFFLYAAYLKDFSLSLEMTKALSSLCGCLLCELGG